MGDYAYSYSVWSTLSGDWLDKNEQRPRGRQYLSESEARTCAQNASRGLEHHEYIVHEFEVGSLDTPGQVIARYQNGIDLMVPTAFKGFSESQLCAVFNDICDPQDWRAPIEGFCDLPQKELIAAAIEFYTATPTEFVKVRSSGSACRMAFYSIGYRLGPAGDH